MSDQSMSDDEAPALSDEAEELLDSLGRGHGGDIAEPSVYPGVGAFSDHAQVYFNNAAMLCHEPRAHDFAVFGALYCIRHGLELWLKWIAHTQLMTAVLEAMGDGKTLDEIVEISVRGRDGKKKRAARRSQLVKALCVIRNAENGLTYPASNIEQIEETFAKERLAKGPLRRESLERLWPIPVDGHDLRTLWAEAREYVCEIHYDARQKASTSGVGIPLPPEKIGALCELLGRWDPGGDGFRYPCSLEGKWFIDLPPLNLRALGELAEELETTVLAYEPGF